jgi:hypothetical protein
MQRSLSEPMKVAASIFSQPIAGPGLGVAAFSPASRCQWQQHSLLIPSLLSVPGTWELSNIGRRHPVAICIFGGKHRRQRISGLLGPLGFPSDLVSPKVALGHGNHVSNAFRARPQLTIGSGTAQVKGM